MYNYEQKAKDFLNQTNTTFETEYLKHDKYFQDDKQTRDIYQITLKRENKKFKFTFGQSIMNNGIEPTEYGVLSCLTKYDPGTFEDFCIDYGYNNGSIKAKKIYKNVVKEYKNVIELWNAEEIEQLKEIE